MDIVLLVCIGLYFVFKLVGSFGLKDGDLKEIQKTLDEFKKKENIKTKFVNSNENANIKDYKLSVVVSDKEKETLKKLGFIEDDFLKGADDAIDIVNFLFTKKHFDDLKKVLSENLYKQFKEQIDGLEKQGQFLKSDLIAIRSKKINTIKLEKTMIYIDLDVETEQINYIEDKSGNVVYGNKRDRNLIKEIWTFERKLSTKEETFWIINNVKTI